jgi:pimeloyl-ACP methyl ester carboxylesterase
MQAVMTRYPELQVPLVTINSTADASTPIEQARRLHRTVPGSHLVELPGAGHEVMFFHPDEVMRAIGAVLRQAAQK